MFTLSFLFTWRLPLSLAYIVSKYIWNQNQKMLNLVNFLLGFLCLSFYWMVLCLDLLMLFVFPCMAKNTAEFSFITLVSHQAFWQYCNVWFLFMYFRKWRLWLILKNIQLVHALKNMLYCLADGNILRGFSGAGCKGKFSFNDLGILNWFYEGELYY